MTFMLFEPQRLSPVHGSDDWGFCSVSPCSYISLLGQPIASGPVIHHCRRRLAPRYWAFILKCSLSYFLILYFNAEQFSYFCYQIFYCFPHYNNRQGMLNIELYSYQDIILALLLMVSGCLFIALAAFCSIICNFGALISFIAQKWLVLRSYWQLFYSCQFLLSLRASFRRQHFNYSQSLNEPSFTF